MLFRSGGPLFDRMDLTVRVDRVDPSLIIDPPTRDRASIRVRERVATARRFGTECRPRGIRPSLEPAARTLLESAARSAQLSGRGVTRVLRVARTIADLEHSRTIQEGHVAEAIGYRAREYR